MEVHLLPLHEGEVAVIQATVDFANIEAWSVRQVEQLFRSLNVPQRLSVTLQGRGRHNDVRYRHHQEKVRDWLASIAERGSVPRVVEEEIGEVFRRSVKIETSHDFVEGRVLAQQKVSLNGIDACCAFAVILLESRGLADRLGQCALEECDRYFFDATTLSRRQRYCCAEHANTDRQRRHRQKKAKR